MHTENLRLKIKFKPWHNLKVLGWKTKISYERLWWWWFINVWNAELFVGH